ncbi:unnamed protein product [Angiostrongylus costaricensis]|uniref:AraC family transcriptional regulator n=1 Tax=Angiostrongylus costaricensis TaxID=334426 RepID=A0A0R3PVB9_ANGCS|nr:unnamed protein product [Angiostrongylus costaricensis]
MPRRVYSRPARRLRETVCWGGEGYRLAVFPAGLRFQHYSDEVHFSGSMRTVSYMSVDGAMNSEHISSTEHSHAAGRE